LSITLDTKTKDAAEKYCGGLVGYIEKFGIKGAAAYEYNKYYDKWGCTLTHEYNASGWNLESFYLPNSGSNASAFYAIKKAGYVVLNQKPYAQTIYISKPADKILSKGESFYNIYDAYDWTNKTLAALEKSSVVLDVIVAGSPKDGRSDILYRNR